MEIIRHTSPLSADPQAGRSWLKRNLLYIALIQAIVAVLGSLYFSNIRNFPPCVLCWWQRIFMYPIVLTLIIGIIRRDRLVHLYVLPAAIIGWSIALYHSLLYYKIIPDTLAPCSTGVSCTTKYLEYFGFVTIPLLSFIAFSVIILCMYGHARFYKNN